MNISSVVVKVLPEYSQEVINCFLNSNFCEFHHYEDGNIIVTIEGVNVDAEIEKMKKIEKTEHVISASLVYSYLEDEIVDKTNNVEISEDLPSWLNDETMDARNIPYGGDIKKKI